MDSSWSEVQHICDPNLNKVSPVSAVCWDPYHELLWVGNDSVSIYLVLNNQQIDHIYLLLFRAEFVHIMEKDYNVIHLGKPIKMNKYDKYV
jgi:hypothetical protein